MLPGRYIISEYGDIIDKKTNKSPRIVMPSGYKLVALRLVTGELKTLAVHKLVLATFSPCHIVGENLCNHKDSDKLNNHISNLEYCTASYNTRHAIQNVRRQLSEDNSISNYKGYINKSGINNNNVSALNVEQVNYICKRMEDNTPYPQILEELGLPVTKQYLDLLTKIRTKHLWCCVSNNYNLPNKEYRSEAIHYSEDELRKMCEMIKIDAKCAEIANALNIPFDSKKDKDKFRHLINRLKNKKIIY